MIAGPSELVEAALDVGVEALPSCSDPCAAKMTSAVSAASCFQPPSARLDDHRPTLDRSCDVERPADERCFPRWLSTWSLSGSK